MVYQLKSLLLTALLLICLKVIAATPYELPRSSALCGFKVTFESGEFIVYYNCGDDGVALFNQLPKTSETIKSELLDSLV